MEIMQGMRNKQELAEFLAVFNSWPVNIINIKESVCEHAMMLVEEYTLSHSMQFGDALIAATAIDRGMTLATANVKHYKFVSNLRLETFKP
jgi:predicted nucleic acid-binding protein